MNQNPTTIGDTDVSNLPLICFSHLRWNFVIQRPQHLMQQFAERRDVTYWEEPLFEGDREPSLQLIRCGRTGVTVVMPMLPAGRDAQFVEDTLKRLLDGKQIIGKDAYRKAIDKKMFEMYAEPDLAA